MNEGFTDYPTLIYDGPFSDHITQMKPKFLEGAQTVSADTAQTTAALFLNEQPQNLARPGDTEGNLPATGSPRGINPSPFPSRALCERHAEFPDDRQRQAGF